MQPNTLLVAISSRSKPDTHKLLIINERNMKKNKTYIESQKRNEYLRNTDSNPNPAQGDGWTVLQELTREQAWHLLSGKTWESIN